MSEEHMEQILCTNLLYNLDFIVRVIILLGLFYDMFQWNM